MNIIINEKEKYETSLIYAYLDSVGVRGQIFACVLITTKDMEVVAIDLDISLNTQVARSYELHVIVDILVFSSLQEWTFSDTRILLSRLKDRDCIISKVERYNESPVNVLRNLSIELGCIPQNLFIVVDVLKEINLRLFGDKIIKLSKSINLVSKTVMWRNLNDNCRSRCRLFNVAKWEMSLVLLQIEILSGLVNTANTEHSTIGG